MDLSFVVFVCFSLAVFSSSQKKFAPSHRIFGHMHGVLNVDEKNNDYTYRDKFARQIF
jgi:hypothetical protein